MRPCKPQFVARHFCCPPRCLCLFSSLPSSFVSPSPALSPSSVDHDCRLPIRPQYVLEECVSSAFCRPRLPLRDPSLGGRQLTSHSALRDSKCRVCPPARHEMSLSCLFFAPLGRRRRLPTQLASLRLSLSLLSSPVCLPLASFFCLVLRSISPTCILIHRIRLWSHHLSPALLCFVALTSASLSLSPVAVFSSASSPLPSAAAAYASPTDSLLPGFSSVIRSGVVPPPCPPLSSQTSPRSPCVAPVPLSSSLSSRHGQVPLTVLDPIESDSIRGAH